MKSVESKFLIAIGLLVLVMVAGTFALDVNRHRGHTAEIMDRRAELAVEFGRAIRDQVCREIQPAMAELLGGEEVLPEAVTTSHVMRGVFERVQERFPEYRFRVAAVNPRNPQNQARNEDAPLLEYFARHPEAREWTGEISFDGEPFSARVTAQRMGSSCLRCHGSPQSAPQGLRERYGAEAGFGYAVGDLAGLEIIAFPFAAARSGLAAHLREQLPWAAVMVAAAVLVTLLIFRWLVTRRLRVLADHFAQSPEATQLGLDLRKVGGRDEIRRLAEHFNHLAERLRMSYATLEEEVRVRTNELTATNEILGAQIIQRKRAEELARRDAARFATMIRLTKAAILVADREGLVVEANDEAGRLIGVDRVDLIGQPITSGPAEDLFRGLWSEMHETLKQKSPAPVDMSTPWKGGELRIQAQPVMIGEECEGVVIDLEDVTALGRAEQQLEKVTRAKRAFVDNVGHEIRTPINGILGGIDLLLASPLSRVQRNHVQTVERSATTLLRLVNDVLDFSLIESGKAELEEIDFDVRDTLGLALEPLTTEAVRKGLTLQLEVDGGVPQLVCGDPGRLRQVTRHLVGNALKFTERGEVTVQVTVAEQADGETQLHFTVRDTGIGISREKLEEIFEAFTQADGSTTRRYNGTGLGLTLTVYIVRLMGGQLWAESAVGEGSTFHFTVPFGVATVRRALSSNVFPGVLKGLRTLLVDDSASSRQILRNFLEDWHVEVDEADGAEDAYAKMTRAGQEARPYRLVLVDAHAPATDGFELARRIKHGPLKEITVVMLTSAGVKGDAARCREAGVAAYLTKPIKSSSILEALALALEAGPEVGAREDLITRHSLRERRTRPPQSAADCRDQTRGAA